MANDKSGLTEIVKNGKIHSNVMNAARQISRRFDRATGTLTRSAADYSISAAISVVPDPLEVMKSTGSGLQRNNRHIEGVDGGRLLANYLVVLLHAKTALQFVDVRVAEGSFWRMVCGCWCDVALPTLFFISGYFMSDGYERHGYRGLVFRRIKRLGVPYLVWNVLFILLYIGCSFFTQVYANRVEQLKLLSPAGWFAMFNPIAQCIDGPCWYLRSLVIFALVYPLIEWVIGIKKGLFALLVLLGWCVFSYQRNLEEALYLSFPAYALMTFFFGAWMRLNRIDVFALVNRWTIMLGVVLVLAWTCLSFVWGCRLFWMRNVTLAVSFVIILGLGRALERYFGKSQAYSLLRECAFFVYAVHIIVCPIFSHAIACIVPLDCIGAPTLLVLGYFLLGSALSIGLYFLIGGISIPFRRLLNGGI